MGPRPMTLGPPPQPGGATMGAGGLLVFVVTSNAAAPSLIPLDVPAVTVPSDRNAGLSLASLSADASSRGYSSFAKVEPSGSVTATSSSVKTQSVRALAARRWLSSANASCSWRPILYCAATTSAVSPSEIVQSFLRRGFGKPPPPLVSAPSGAFWAQGPPHFTLTHGAPVRLSPPPPVYAPPFPALF